MEIRELWVPKKCGCQPQIIIKSFIFQHAKVRKYINSSQGKLARSWMNNGRTLDEWNDTDINQWWMITFVSVHRRELIAHGRGNSKLRISGINAAIDASASSWFGLFIEFVMLLLQGRVCVFFISSRRVRGGFEWIENILRVWTVKLDSDFSRHTLNLDAGVWIFVNWIGSWTEQRRNRVWSEILRPGAPLGLSSSSECTHDLEV